jgi:hypothetical protein
MNEIEGANRHEEYAIGSNEHNHRHCVAEDNVMYTMCQYFGEFLSHFGAVFE